MNNKYAIGIDIGGTNTKFGIVNEQGNVLSRGSISTSKHENIASFIEELKTAIDTAIEKFGGKNNIKGIGIGAPNANYYTGTIENAPNLKWKGIIPLTKLINEKFEIPATLTNDAKAAALGEMMYGAARGMKDFIMITLGTGVGSGIVANGQLVLGQDGFAGEIGHTIIIREGRLHPGTGLRGSLETYASATGVALTAVEILEKSDKPSLLRKYATSAIDSKLVYDCAMQGDAIAKSVFEFTGKILGEALANFVMFSSPESIILFGGLTKAGDWIMKPVKENMEKNLMPVFRNKVKLIFSELKEGDAAILGASALAWEMKE